ncbi:MAG: VanZ family protein [Mariprofundaceae bacterium]
MNAYPNPVWGILLLAYCGLIFMLSDQSHLPAPLWFDGQDKIIHAIAYAVMAALFWLAFDAGQQARPGLMAFAAVLFCALYGASDEWHQSFVTGRDASVRDWLADTLGAMVFSGLRLKAGRDVRRKPA